MDRQGMEFAVKVPGSPEPIRMSYNGVQFFPPSELEKARAEVLRSIGIWYDRLFHAWKNNQQEIVHELLQAGPTKPSASDMGVQLLKANLNGRISELKEIESALTWFPETREQAIRDRIVKHEKARDLLNG